MTGDRVDKFPALKACLNWHRREQCNRCCRSRLTTEARRSCHQEFPFAQSPLCFKHVYYLGAMGIGILFPHPVKLRGLASATNGFQEMDCYPLFLHRCSVRLRPEFHSGGKVADQPVRGALPVVPHSVIVTLHVRDIVSLCPYDFIQCSLLSRNDTGTFDCIS